MRHCHLFLMAVLVTLTVSVAAQSTITLRNSTDHTYDVSIEQSGSHTLSASEYTIHNNSIPGWLEDDQQVVTVDRDNAAVPNGDTIYFSAVLSKAADTVRLQLHLTGTTGGSELAYAVGGPGFSHPWFTDGNFHANSSTIAGTDVTVKYRPENPDTAQGRDILVALQQSTIYTIDSSDFQDPNVLNVMAYNVQMLPTGLVGMPQAALRSDLLPAHFSPWQDVVIFCEVFDNPARNDHLIPAMQNAGFPHHTTILNAQGGGGTIPANGGVMIFSRWPIVDSDEIEYAECGPASADCAAAKGVKYAEIDKMGKHYHVFGTHMDAGGNQADIEARRSQIGEIRQFIDTSGIPGNEPVLIGGDFNLGPSSSGGLFPEFKDTMNPVVPEPIGFYESTFSGDTGNIIDHVWADSRYLLPTEATNNILTFRSIADTMWELSEFSDHRSVQGRFVFPDITATGPDSAVCMGESLSMSISTGVNASYQWQRNGQAISNATNSTYSVQNAAMSDTGDYSCLVNYEETYGTVNNNIVNHLYPNGPVTFQANFGYQLGRIDDCAVGISETSQAPIRVYPNPASGTFQVELPGELTGEPKISAYDLQGRLVKRDVLRSSTSQFDLGEVGSGTYLLKVHNDERVWRGKVVVR